MSDSYYRVTENELLEDYLKVQNFLIIDEKNQLQNQLREHEVRNQQENYVIKGKLLEKEEEISFLKERDRIKEESISDLSDQLILIQKRMDQLEKPEFCLLLTSYSKVSTYCIDKSQCLEII